MASLQLVLPRRLAPPRTSPPHIYAAASSISSSPYRVPFKNFNARSSRLKNMRRRPSLSNKQEDGEREPNLTPGEEKDYDVGVRVAISLLKFYKSEISPLLPRSCRYVPTCSEYSMEAYKRYGVAKGTILTTWRLCRCNPLGGSGFDPPRWFGEEKASEIMNNDNDIG